MRNWGLDYEHLRKIKSDLIMFSTCMQGQTGPNAMYPGFGQLMAALSGFYYISGYGEGQPPAPPYGAYSDFIAPRFLTSALIAALDYKRRTGKGQYIDMSQYEAALHNLAPALIDYFATGRELGTARQRLDALRTAWRLSMRGRRRRRALDRDSRFERCRMAIDAHSSGSRRRATRDLLRSYRESKIASRSISSSAASRAIGRRTI